MYSGAEACLGELAHSSLIVALSKEPSKPYRTDSKFPKGPKFYGIILQIIIVIPNIETLHSTIKVLLKPLD